MLKKVSFVFLTFVLFYSLVFLSALDGVNADTNPELDQERQEFLGKVKDFDSEYQQSDLKELDSVKNSVQKGEIELHNKNLNYTNAFAKENNSQKVIYVPLEVEGVKSELNYSVLGVILDNKGQIKNYVELQIIGNDVNYTADVKSYMNGNLVKSKVLELNKKDFETSADSSLKVPGEKKAQAKSWWSKFSTCMNNMGVASWAISAISVACSAVCVGTAGAGCAACIVAAGLATEGVAAKCVTEASL
ncbi:hypothetical protein MXM59_10865 [Mammaliicoccus sciuri]|uniref:hypothetical protein n=1 Tax=Mammaliicoccus sciuri TaxID=1296 RepID=UPI0009C22376|nr:hypothetical protein [Mammaliicoccus sciuri]ARB39717.1 hypothetical protein B5728_01895 [Mammaliicoccus sciuri]MEB6227729.1 hypothetical protein [Mammaliicoccus sciuri]